MSKIIKHHIKRSLPLFLIFSLIISSTVFGLVFNFDFSGFYKSTDNSTFRPEAQAAGSATTTVEVLNAPPAYVVNGEPKEVPASTSTSPVNVGDAIGFAATASDPENNQYRLLICSAGGTAQPDAANPQCPVGATQFCRSNATNSGSEATCTYNVVDPIPTAETDEWYAFVCDTHASQAYCSETASQGAAPGNYASSSPFYINHAPFFTGLITSDNYKDPGGTFTVRATTTDLDALGGADGAYLYVCSSNSFSTTTGCGAETWCTGAATSSTYIECSFASSTAPLNWVTPDGTFNYWGFVMDSHYFEATSTPLTSSYTVNNVAPTVSSVSLNDDALITLSLKDAAEVEVTASGTIADLNGCWDITSATATIYWSGIGTTSIGCAADDDNCYPIGTTACTYNGGCSGMDDTSWYVCTTTLAFHAIPSTSDNSNPYGWTVWMAGLAGFDESAFGYNTNDAGSAPDVDQSEGLDVQEPEIQYGQIRGGQNTGWDNATTTVENFGNVPMDTNLVLDDMVKTDLLDYIEAINQEFGTTTFAYGAGTYSIASTSDQDVFVDIIKPTTGNLDIMDEIYWGIGIPGGTTSGNYEGRNYFSVVVDPTQW
ncbi:hypothetical protein A2303_06605 [Candidatus Falkowbacteria bacterium RIFOXYB2_FULL_47_14]|uniref:Uncharacterized protein n=1 Tax=Candidatus Falkowbacteria bacterium RIFOXYA2_FULL_47_19 TaxID=1797994 RepID=A0A1F5SJI6_9BACT|nr:MAG: hypothetical protein A2227_06230 [Candidatus Falkowbacteria bacterium RIFOXYA2_FULL_47_19]OGF35908.1 MAG: hypothetical protein A2468_01685 [Candidatus Falkowbacteria bacterium RIFOXYC2_FULL_46_15]OGF42825.1 MAG: hypothetical protein A2303_06605 [Candidatus Falkowbacteria bacterium RIFOXYB2_FULL_47_14]